jgi:hypothetical protein
MIEATGIRMHDTGYENRIKDKGYRTQETG